VFCSAFFSVSETAFSTFNKIRMRKRAQDGDRRAAAVLAIWDNYDHSLSSILVGNNIANITASALATLLATSLWGPARGAAAATVGMTLILLTFGEVVPKNLAKEYADRLAVMLARPLSVVIKLLSPVSVALTGISRVVLGKREEAGPSITEEELSYMVDSIEESVLEEQERELVQSALAFDETSLREILTPRVNVVAVDALCGLEELRRVTLEQGYSRIPVYEKTVDNIVGVLYTRDLLLALLEGREINVREMMGKPLYVHKGMKLSHLLASFKANQLNLAVVVDEYGGTLGIVTMEDVLEELVGDIWDEDDEITQGLVSVGEDAFEAAGDYCLPDLLERLEIDASAVDTDYSTVSGWALKELAHIPAQGEVFTGAGYVFTVLEMDGRRIKKLGIKKEADSDRDSGDGV
jgi:CBS domain containing-hemolysin-like protein